jgi:hypothetical protein
LPTIGGGEERDFERFTPGLEVAASTVELAREAAGNEAGGGGGVGEGRGGLIGEGGDIVDVEDEAGEVGDIGAETICAGTPPVKSTPATERDEAGRAGGGARAASVRTAKERGSGPVGAAAYSAAWGGGGGVLREAPGDRVREDSV